MPTIVLSFSLVCVWSVTLLYPTLCDPMDCVACQASLSVRFSRQEDWSRLPFPFPNPGIEPASLVSLALTGRVFTTEPPGKPLSLT